MACCPDGTETLHLSRRAGLLSRQLGTYMVASTHPTQQGESEWQADSQASWQIHEGDSVRGLIP